MSGARVALVGATPDFHARLRAHFGLAPAVRSHQVPRGLAYCGQEYRIYPSMRIGDAVRLFSAINERWDDARLRDDLQTAGLGERFEIRRMKRAYQRALVLAFAVAAQPAMLVVENAEEFAEAGAATLLEGTLRRLPAALVTFAEGASPDPAQFDRVLSAQTFAAESFA